jgi:hypothetical protein
LNVQGDDTHNNSGFSVIDALNRQQLPKVVRMAMGTTVFAGVGIWSHHLGRAGGAAKTAYRAQVKKTKTAHAAKGQTQPADSTRRVFSWGRTSDRAIAIREGIDAPVPECCTAITQCTGFGVRHE